MTPPARVAIVDGYSTGRFLAERLSDLGARCIHVASQPDIPAIFTHGFDDRPYDHDLGFLGDFDRLAGVLRRWGATAVVPGTESGVLLADRLTDRLGLPGNAPQHRRARRDKYLMARTVAAAGVRAPAGDLLDNADMAVGWFGAHDFEEVVVKPVDSVGGDHVYFCADAAQAAEATRRVLESSNLYGARNRHVLIQERLAGVEHYVNSVSIDGSHLMVETWRYTKRRGPSGGVVYDYEEPVAPASPTATQLHAFAARVLDALDIRNGAAHTEIMLTPSGPALIETGARLGGGTQPSVTEKYSGTSQALALAQALTGDAAAAGRHPAWDQHVRNVNLINPTAGVARDTTWVERLQQLASVVRVVPAVSRGAHLGVTRDLATAPGYLYLVHPDLRRIESDYATIRDWERDGLYVSCGVVADGE